VLIEMTTFILALRNSKLNAGAVLGLLLVIRSLKALQLSTIWSSAGQIARAQATWLLN